MFAKKTCPATSIKTMLDDHIELVEMVLFKALETMEHYFTDNIETAKAHARGVNDLESEADAVRRRIVTCLHGGAFLPIMRKDVFQLASAIDDVANAAEDFCDFCLSQRPEIPKDFREDFLEITRDSAEMFPNLKKGVGMLSSGEFGWRWDESSPLYKITRQIGVEESNIDELKWKLTRKIFNSDLPLANKIHIKSLLDQIAKVSDLIEDAADRIEILIAREAI